MRLYESDRRRPLLFTAWQAYEFKNTVWLAARKFGRAGQPLPFQPGNTLKRNQEALDGGRLRHAEVDWLDNFQLANGLSDKHTRQVGAGAVDVWHVAAAILLNADTFWTFDADQHALAGRTKFFKTLPRLTGA